LWILVSTNLVHNRTFFEYEDFVVVSLNGNDKNSTIVGNFYKSPSSSAEANDRLLIDTLCSNYKCRQE